MVYQKAVLKRRVNELDIQQRRRKDNESCLYPYLDPEEMIKQLTAQEEKIKQGK